MGLLDVINGMQQGPRGPSTSSPESEKSEGGMSPMTMAILGLLAWKAIKHFTGNQSGTAPQPAPQRTPQVTPQPTPQTTAAPSEASSTDIGGMLKGALGGLLAGGAAGSVLSGGLNDLMKQLQQGGQGEVAKSWVGTGPNKAISPNDLGDALGASQIDELSTQSGLPREELLNGLSRYLPQVVDHLTPEGKLPSESEVSNRL